MRKILLLASAAVLAVSGASAAVFVPVLKEGFTRSVSTTPGGGYYAESLYFDSDEHADNAGWTSNSVYEAERAVKFNAKTKTGWLATPELKLSSETATVKVLFRAQPWTNDTPDLYVEVDGNTAGRQLVDIDTSTGVADRSCEPFELTFTDVPNGAKIKFYSEKRTSDKLHRFFLSDIVVLEDVEAAQAPGLYCSAYYHRFSDLMAGQPSERRTIDVVAVGNTEPITISQEDKSNFIVSKAEGWNDLEGGRLIVDFAPRNAGSKLETLAIGYGDFDDNVLLAGHAKVYAPVVSEPSDIATDAFTAQWQPAAGMDELVLTVYTKEEAPLVSSNLMFTKYIEGKSNNRALEIFNGTGTPVSLKGWKLRMESNLSGGIVANQYDLPDQMLENGKTFSICNAQFAELRDVADKTIGYSDGGYANITTFTGDDAIGLFDPDDRLVDLLGYESIDCNDLVNGVWGMDVTYYRRSDSYDPHPKFYIEEWVEHEKDYCADFGKHSMDATGLVRKVVKKLTLDGDATSALVDGLMPGVTYYYAVEGHSNGLLTPSSKEASATTATTGVENVAVESAAPEAYYNLQGQRIARPDKGMVIRCQGGKASKLKL